MLNQITLILLILLNVCMWGIALSEDSQMVVDYFKSLFGGDQSNNFEHEKQFRDNISTLPCEKFDSSKGVVSMWNYQYVDGDYWNRNII